MKKILIVCALSLALVMSASLPASAQRVIYGTGTATAAGAAATLNRDSGLVTTEALTTAAGAAYTLTLTNSKILPTSKIFVNVANGTNTQGVVSGSANAVAGNGTATVRVLNQHASQAFNGTLKISYLVINP